MNLAKLCWCVSDSGNRLQAAVDNLLDLITTTTRQLHDAQATQRDLAKTLDTRTDELDQLQQKLEDADQRLKDETEAREYLAVELNKAESRNSSDMLWLWWWGDNEQNIGWR